MDSETHIIAIIGPSLAPQTYETYVGHGKQLKNHLIICSNQQDKQACLEGRRGLEIAPNMARHLFFLYNAALYGRNFCSQNYPGARLPTCLSDY